MLKSGPRTIAAPILQLVLFILVFGLALGARIKRVDGVDYDAFVPGLLTMAIVQAVYSDDASSVFQARFDRYLRDVLAAPMRGWEMNLGLTLGDIVRALLIGAGLIAAAAPVTGVPLPPAADPGAGDDAGAGALRLLGVVVGIFAGTSTALFVDDILILPLTFLAGLLLGRPPPDALARALPRQPDLLPAPGGPLRLFGARRRERGAGAGGHGCAGGPVSVAWSAWLFATGHRLKPWHGGRRAAPPGQ